MNIISQEIAEVESTWVDRRLSNCRVIFLSRDSFQAITVRLEIFARVDPGTQLRVVLPDIVQKGLEIIFRELGIVISFSFPLKKTTTTSVC